MHPWPSCNGRTRNAVSMITVYEYVLGPITFIAPLPTSPLYCISVGKKQSLCPLMWGAQEKSEGAHKKNFGRRFAPALCPPTCKLLPTPLPTPWAAHGHWPAATPKFFSVTLVRHVNVAKRHLDTSSHLARAHCLPEIVQPLADLNLIDPSTPNRQAFTHKTESCQYKLA